MFWYRQPDFSVLNTAIFWRKLKQKGFFHSEPNLYIGFSRALHLQSRASCYPSPSLNLFCLMKFFVGTFSFLLLPYSPPWRVVFQSFFHLSGLFRQLKKKNMPFFLLATAIPGKRKNRLKKIVMLLNKRREFFYNIHLFAQCCKTNLFQLTRLALAVSPYTRQRMFDISNFPMTG